MFALNPGLRRKGPSKPGPFDKEASKHGSRERAFWRIQTAHPLRLISRKVPKLPTLQWLRQGSMLPTLRSC